MSLEVKIEELTKQVAELTSVIAKIINLNGVEATKNEKTTPSIPEPEKEVVEPEKEPEPKKVTRKVKEAVEKVTLGDLKESAKNAVERSSREAVKACISKFADKLSDVKESDYVELNESLKAL
jgi:hypothetical protein